MKIRSRKTGSVHEVSKEQWAEMQKRFDNRHYDVIDDSDESLGSVVVEVEEIVAFDRPDDDMAEKSETVIYDFDDEDEEVEWLKGKLDEADIYYHPRTGIVKLRNLYEQI